MNKKVKSLFLASALIVGLAGMAVSCKDYDKDLADLQEQINEQSTKLTDLGNKITSGSVITSVAKTADGKGVVITLSNGDSYEIKGGQDGAAGANGKDADVWTIGQDGYWYKNNVKTEYKAVGQDGAAGAAGAAGAPGKDGNDGKDGKDGNYYVPNAETGFFDLYSADGEFIEATTIKWQGTGVSAVETEDAVILSNVQKEDGTVGTVTITKNNNLRSLVFIPQVYVDGVEGMNYEQFQYTPLRSNNLNKATEIWTSRAGKTVINPTLYAEYHVNPSNVNVEDLKDLAFKLIADAPFVTTRAKSNKLKVTPAFESFEKGILKVKVTVEGTAATEDFISVVALQATRANGEMVVSDYATLYQKDLDDVIIAEPKAVTAKCKPEGVKDVHYRKVMGASDPAAYNKEIIWQDGDEEAVVRPTCDTIMLYDREMEGGVLDLLGIVEAHDAKTDAIVDIEKLGLSWAFEIVTGYTSGTPKTEQDKFIEFVDDAKTKVAAKVFDTEGIAAAGRTPIIRVKLLDGSEVVKVAYIKIYIAKENEVIPEEMIELKVPAFALNCDKEEVSVETTVEQMNKELYNVVGYSKEDFHALFTFSDWGADPANFKDGKVDPGTVEEVINTTTESTIVLRWTLSMDEIWEKAGATEISHRILYSKSNGTKVFVKLVTDISNVKKVYNVDKNADYIREYWSAAKDTTYYNVRTPIVGETDPDNCYFINNINASFVTWKVEDGKGTPGVLKLQADGEFGIITAIEYFFCKDVANIKQIVNEETGEKVPVTFSVSEDGLTLSATIADKEILKKLGAEGDKLTEEIAWIDNAGAKLDLPNTFELNKESKIGKYLLNTNGLYTFIGAKGLICDDDERPVSITFDGKDHFVAAMIRPIGIDSESDADFIDAVDFGEKGSYMTIEDLINPYDWRKDDEGNHRKFSEYTNYWDYYGPFKVTVDTKNIKCNLNGKVDTLPETLVVNQMTKDELLAQLTGTDEKTKKCIEEITAAETDFGFLTYKNNGTNVDDFEMYVTVTVEYGWGFIETAPITVKVYKTIKKN